MKLDANGESKCEESKTFAGELVFCFVDTPKWKVLNILLAMNLKCVFENTSYYQYISCIHCWFILTNYEI